MSSTPAFFTPAHAPLIASNKRSFFSSRDPINRSATIKLTLAEPKPTKVPNPAGLPHRFTPEVTTQLISDNVGVLQFTGWKTTLVSPGECETLLPLSRASANQHGAHQASMAALNADYAGGIALASLFPETPVKSVDAAAPNEPTLLMWLGSMNVKYHKPATAHMLARAVIPSSEFDKIRRRFHRGKKQLVPVTVELLDDKRELVSTATMVYFIMKSGASRERNILSDHREITAARLAANLRSRERILFRDDLAGKMGAVHGKVLGDIVLEQVPDMQEMITQRTLSADRAVVAGYEAGLRTLVTIGAGLDTRAARLAESCPDLTVYDVDVPSMIAERREAHAEHGGAVAKQHYVKCDLETDDLAAALGEAGYNGEGVMVVFEGGTMFYDEESLRKVLRNINNVLKGEGRLWMDFVREDVINGRGGEKVREFMERVSLIGEPYVFGVDDSREILDKVGMRVVSMEDCLAARSAKQGILGQYYFVTARTK